MNLLSRLKHAATLVLGFALTIVMFPVFLATTTFILMTGLVVALFGAYKIRQLEKQRNQAGEFNTREMRRPEKAAIEGDYYVVYPVS